MDVGVKTNPETLEKIGRLPKRDVSAPENRLMASLCSPLCAPTGCVSYDQGQMVSSTSILSLILLDKKEHWAKLNNERTKVPERISTPV